jgi:hypothetical protein
MTSADVLTRLTHSLRLDLIGPAATEPQAAEILNRASTRWNLSGFLAPWNAPAAQKEDEEAGGDRRPSGRGVGRRRR